MRRSLAPAEKPEGGDPYGELAQYLDAMVDNLKIQINQAPEEALTGREPLSDIFRAAIQMEKDAVLFYSGLRDAAAPALGRKRLDDIIHEEMRHIVWLSAQAKAS